MTRFLHLRPVLLSLLALGLLLGVGVGRPWAAGKPPSETERAALGRRVTGERAHAPAAARPKPTGATPLAGTASALPSTTITVDPAVRVTRSNTIRVRVTFKNPDGFTNDSIALRGVRLHEAVMPNVPVRTIVSRVLVYGNEYEDKEVYVEADLPLVVGANELFSRACPFQSSTGNFCVTRRDTFFYDPNLDVDPPAGSATPFSYTRVYDPSLPVTVQWEDNRVLMPATHTVTLNGAAAPGFVYSVVDSAHGVSSGTLALQHGANELRVRMCDRQGNCGTMSARYTFDPNAPPPPPPPTDSAFTSPGVFIPGTQIRRGECVTISAGPGAAYECGDLRLAHPLPASRVYNAVSAPALVWSSGTARPNPVLPFNVAMPGGGAPSSVTAVLRVGALGQPLAEVKRRTYANAGWSAGALWRFAIDYDAQSSPTGVYVYQLQVLGTFGGVEQEMALHSGEMTIVNRAGSPFGPGWWLAGLDQLLYQPDGSFLLVEGDGSTRRYHWIAPGEWRSPSVERPDTLRAWGMEHGSYYHRRLPNGSRVWYNYQMRHELTWKPRADFGIPSPQTAFRYGTDGRLEKIELPTPTAGLEAGYTFTYDAAGRLASACAYATGSSCRTTTFQHALNDGRITSITDPDTRLVSFGHSGVWISSRTDQRSVTNTFAYGPGARLQSSTTVVAEAGHSIIHQFTPGETRGIATPIAAARATAVYNGPRVDVADTVAFWQNRWGAPTRVQDAMGGVASVTRGDPRFPALVTESRAPNGLRSLAHYDARGRPDSVMTLNPLGDGRHSLSTYTYDDKWNAPTSVRGFEVSAGGVATPLAGASETAYDPSWGRPMWKQDGRGAASRVDFNYNAAGLLTSSVLPSQRASGGMRDSTEYDGWGNVSRVRTPSGRWTTMNRDAYGRVTQVLSPLQGALVTNTETGYDQMDRVTWTTTYAPDTDGRNGSQYVRVDNAYYEDGTPRQVTRMFDPDSNHIGVATTTWVRDGAGRVIKEIASDGARDSTVYNPAGQAVAVYPRRGGVIRMRYDVLGRMVQRILPPMVYNLVPVSTTTDSESFPRYALHAGSSEKGLLTGDTLQYVYDPVGMMVAATNRDAVVLRSYYPNGAIKTDSSFIRAYDYSETYTPSGLSYTYDMAGRRTGMQYPQNSVGAGAAVGYGYNAQSGNLETLTALGGGVFTLGYNDDGQLASTASPGGLNEILRYNADGQPRRRIVTISNDYVGTADGWPASGGLQSASVRSDTTVYDERGKVLWAGNVGERVTNTYAAMGGLSGSVATNPSSLQRLLVDPMGNAVRDSSRVSNGDAGWTQTLRTYRYQGGGTGRLQSSRAENMNAYQGVGTPQLTDSTGYDAAGNRTYYGSQTVLQFDEVSDTATTTAVRLDESSRYYYDAAGQLRATDRRRCIARNVGPQVGYRCVNWEPAPGRDPGVFEEYRYDALGRRVMVRARPTENQCTSGSDNCIANTVYTTWDGDQLLVETRVSGTYGQQIVSYTHGPGIDAPLAVRLAQGGTARDIVPISNWRGLYDGGVFTDGRTVQGSLDLKAIEWPARNYRAFFDYIPPSDGRTQVWLGSLMSHKRDASGQLYMRNRYFDPASGRFTQEDPIGIAGGLNLYGFGGGDPVSYSDAYGLSADCKLPWAWLCKRHRGPLYPYGVTRRLAGTRVTAAEAQYAWRHPVIAAGASVIAERTEAEVTKLVDQGLLHGLEDGPADAVRHAAWMCQVARGPAGVSGARQLGNAHESDKKNPESKRAMDTANNEVGLRLAGESGNCMDLARTAEAGGQLTTINP